MAAARGILSYGTYLPYRRLDRADIQAVAGSGGGTGTRTVASYDEDTTTLGVAAARQALAAAPEGVRPASLWFATVSPAYADKTNATAIHAALRLDPAAPAFDVNGAVRSAVGALRAGLAAGGPALVVAADLRTGLPGSADEARGGDGAAALLVGSEADGPLAAEILGSGSATEEFLDRWRAPGDIRSRQWEERFGEQRYVALGLRAWDDALKDAGLVAEQVDRVVLASAHDRAAAALTKQLGVTRRIVNGLDRTVGFTGAAHPALAAGRRPRLGRRGRGRRPGGAGRRGRRAGGAGHGRGGGRAGRPHGRRPGGRRRASFVRHLPGVAGLPAGRAAPPSRAGPALGVGRQPVPGVEVRVRRRPGRRRGGAPAAGAG